MTVPEYAALAGRSLPPARAANLPLVEEQAAGEEVRKLYARFRETFGRPEVPGILQCFATHPALLEHMMGIARALLFSAGVLGRQQKEMLATFISARNRCGYCTESHGSFLRLNGASPAMTAAVVEGRIEDASLSEKQRALLRFAVQVNDHAERVGPQDIARLREAGWQDAEIDETSHLVALFACFNRVVSAFGLAPQQLPGSTEP
jgi:uncharacterized peroxidase-related enzyme